MPSELGSAAWSPREHTPRPFVRLDMEQLPTSPPEPVIRNRVAESPIEVFNLEELWDDARLMTFDLTDFLDKGFILREKAFRDATRAYDWSEFEGAHVALSCTTDAIVPPWAWMLVATKAAGKALSVTVGDETTVRTAVFARLLADFDWSRYEDRMVVIKGCGSRNVPESAYAEATTRLMGVARKIMYGEPCSSVPIWRRS